MVAKELYDFLVENVLRVYRFPLAIPANLHIFSRFRIRMYAAVVMGIASDRRGLPVFKQDKADKNRGNVDGHSSRSGTASRADGYVRQSWQNPIRVSRSVL